MWYLDALSDFQVSGFNELTMTSHHILAFQPIMSGAALTPAELLTLWAQRRTPLPTPKTTHQLPNQGCLHLGYLVVVTAAPYSKG
jgi:hypothetical protein